MMKQQLWIVFLGNVAPENVLNSCSGPRCFIQDIRQIQQGVVPWEKKSLGHVMWSGRSFEPPSATSSDKSEFQSLRLGIVKITAYVGRISVGRSLIALYDI